MSDHRSRYLDILKYWFGSLTSHPVEAVTQAGVREPLAGRTPASLVDVKKQSKLWFRQKDETDEYIRTHFEEDLRHAVSGGLEAWKDQPRSCLAWVILLDQFSLNLYRNEARAFDQSALAVPVAKDAIRRGWDLSVAPHERVFFYMPLEHAEDPALQEQSVGLFKKLVQDAPAGQRPVFESFLDYAIRHRDVVTRFGRFPDRNPVYGRPPTPDEAKYMADGGVPF